MKLTEQEHHKNICRAFSVALFLFLHQHQEGSIFCLLMLGVRAYCLRISPYFDNYAHNRCHCYGMERFAANRLMLLVPLLYFQCIHIDQRMRVVFGSRRVDNNICSPAVGIPYITMRSFLTWVNNMKILWRKLTENSLSSLLCSSPTPTNSFPNIWMGQPTKDQTSPSFVPGEIFFCVM